MIRRSRPTSLCAAFSRTLAVCAVLLVSLTGCRQVLYSQLGEQEANELVAVLATNGVDVGKTVADKYWGVEVAGSQIPLAMQVLTREGLPRNRYASLGDMFKREGIISTPTEERIRFIHGVSQELSRTLSMIDGVLAARVHIVLPHNDPLADRVRPSSASVFIRHRADTDLQGMLTSIKSLVVRSVEGLSHDSVYVTLFPAERVALGKPELAPEAGLRTGTTWTAGSMPVALAVLVPAALTLLVIGIGIGMGWFGLRYRRKLRWRWLQPSGTAAVAASATAHGSDSSLSNRSAS